MAGLFDNSDKASEISDIASLVFSTTSGDSSDTALTSGSLSINRQTATQLLAKAFAKDTELEALYKQAGSQLSQERFFLNHSRLLKAFFQDLRNEAQNHTSDRFRKATFYLQSRRQREQVTSGIWDQFALVVVEQPVVSPSFPSKQTKNMTSHPMVTEAACVTLPSRPLAPYDDVESEESEEESGDNQPDPSDEITYLLRLFTEGPAFEAFKSGLRSFLNPPRTVEEAVATNSPVVIRRFIRRNFDEMVTGDYPWVKELRDIGLTDDEIARILLNQAVDAPWIVFEPQDVESRQIDIDNHIPGCVHKVLDSHKPEDTVARAASPEDQWHTERLIQELCGLAGVAPISKDREKWNGHADFLGTEQQDVLECQVSILSPDEAGGEDILPFTGLISRITGALERLKLAVAHVQASGLCCDSLTLLSQFDNSENVVKMSRVQYSTIRSLLGLPTSELDPWDTLSPGPSKQGALVKVETLRFILAQLMIPQNFRDDDIEAVLHYFALLVQMLCLAFLSYSQGHTGPLQPFFLDAPVERVRLCGTGPRLADLYGGIEARFTILSCIGDMLGGPVFCFSWVEPGTFQQEVVPSMIRHDLVATAEDMIDTWGPGNLVLAAKGSGIIGFHLGGGFISADTASSKANNGFRPLQCHWSPYSLAVEGKPDPRAFYHRAPILIAATVTENPHCVRDEFEWWTKSSSCSEFQDLGTHHAHWTQAERQLMGQGGQYVVVGANVVWNRVQAFTLKQRKLEAADNELVPFLDDPFGVQVSLCTGVSRRVTLRAMLADLMPVFAKASIEPEQIAAWTALQDIHKILGVLRDGTRNIKDWLIALPDSSLREYAMTLVRDILKILQHTGFNPDTKLLKIAWPHESDLRKCFQIPCKDEAAWLRFFADSNDCVTFAYITTKCLETDSIKCRGSTTPWGNVITVLETAVVCLSTPRPEVQVNTAPKLQHKMVYFFRKSEGKFYVQAEQSLPAGPMRLVLCSSISPSKVQARVREMFNVREKQPICLRERRAMEALMAESVAVSARI